MIRIQADKVDVHIPTGAKTEREITISKNAGEVDVDCKTIDL